MEKEKIDYVIAVGPMPMMKAVADLTRGTGIKTEASMNPIMVDGTGMCGACRLTVGGQVKFACVDGPDFNAHEIDFDEVINRCKIYKDEERKRSENCNLLSIYRRRLNGFTTRKIYSVMSLDERWFTGRNCMHAGKLRMVS